MAQFCPYNKHNLNVETDIKANNFLKNLIFLALQLILSVVGSGMTLLNLNLKCV